MSELTPEGWRNVAAVNARTYAMSEQDREQWYRDHPVTDFGGSEAGAPAGQQPVLRLALPGIPAACGNCGATPGEWPLTSYGGRVFATCPGCWTNVAPAVVVAEGASTSES